MLSEITSIIKTFCRYQRLQHLLGSYLCYVISITIKKPVVKFYPPAVMIEPTNICNLRCPLCPSGEGSLLREKGFMDLEKYKAIIDQIYRKVGILILWNQGEPFLHPKIYEMIEYAAKHNMYVMISTNASLALDTERIIKSGLTKLIISLDGVTQESYQAYRKGGDYKLVLENLSNIIIQRKKIESSTPVIIWQYLVMLHNEHQIKEAEILSKQLHVDKIKFKTAQIYNQEDMQHYLPKEEHYRRYKISGSFYQIKTKLYNRCCRLWTQPQINWDGGFTVCCYDKDATIKIGNISDTAFHNLWFGNSMNKFRQIIITKRKTIPICQNCGEGVHLFL